MPSTSRRLKSVVKATLLAAAAFASLQAGAAEGARKFAAISQLGDKVEIVVYGNKTGSHMDRNQREAIPVADFFEKTALLALDAGLKSAEPGQAASLLLLPPQKTAAGQEGLLDGMRFVPTEAVDAALKRTPATHLLLVSKLKAQAALQGQDMTFGSGNLEGVGLYVDGSLRVRSGNLESQAIGFLAPYAYFKVSLVDLASARVLKQEFIKASATFAPEGDAGADPWDALSSTRKLEVLQGMIRREVIRVMPALLATP